MVDLPVMLRVHGKRCVVVGGGAVAYRRAKSLLRAGAMVTVVAPKIDGNLRTVGAQIEQRPYRVGDLDDAMLAVVATNEPEVNETVAQHAASAGVLVNRADLADAGQISFVAHARHGPVTLSVHTGGISAQAAATILKQLSEDLDPDWERLLEIVAPYRPLIQQRVEDAGHRHQVLEQLTGPHAIETLKLHGVEALRRFCQSLITTPTTQ